MFSFKRPLIALGGVLVIVGALTAVMPLVSRGPRKRTLRAAQFLRDAILP